MTSAFKNRGCRPRNSLSFLILIAFLGPLSATLENNAARRTIRSPSPGLFSGLPSPKELSDNLKPITLADFNALKDQIKGLDGLGKRFEQALAAEKQARNGLLDLVEKTKERISSLENALNPDENSFWGESVTCGGVVVSQTGRISYKQDSYYEAYERCVWTVRANYRSNVKVHLTRGSASLKENGYDYITVTEVPGEDNNASLHTVELDVGHKYVFKGPLLIISFITDGSKNGMGFELEFEGMGRNIYTNTMFKHFHLDNWADSFSAKNVTNPKGQSSNVPLPGLLSSTKRMFSTVVINPQYKNITELTLKVEGSSMNLKPEQCEKSALNFYEYFRDANSSVKRCCGTKCEETEFENNDGVFLATYLGDLKSANDFKFSWGIDTAIPSEDSVNICGGVLSGRVGKISYKVDEEYASNERCTWLIHPTGKSRVKMTLLKQEFEEGYDFLTVTSIGNNYSLDSSEPENTILEKLQAYNFSGPVIFVTFFSDSSSEGKGFELVWEEAGSNLYEPSSTLGLPMHLTEESGSQGLTLYAPIFQVVIINPKYLDGSALHLTLAKLEADLGTTCGSNGLKIFGSDHGNFSVARRFCENTDGGFPSEDFQTTDGIFVLVFHAEKSVGDIEFTWKKGPSRKEATLEGDVAVVQTEGCGGVLIGDSGRIDYKLNTSYSNLEKCTWVIQSTRRSKLTLRLLKDGFESCCDFLVASQLNPENGTISKNYAQIDRQNKFKSFTAQVVFVTFQSDSSVGDHGFSLEFTTSGDLIQNPLTYKHQRLTEINGSVSIPSENELLPLKNEILTFIFTPDPVPGTQETNITVNFKNFGVDKQCQKDSVGIFEVPNFSGSETKRFTCSNIGNQTDNVESCECGTDSFEVSKDVKIVNNRAFVAIVKSVESTTTKSFDIKWTSTSELGTEESRTPES